MHGLNMRGSAAMAVEAGDGGGTGCGGAAMSTIRGGGRGWRRGAGGR